jgi:histidinol-phosphate aminotransferase
LVESLKFYKNKKVDRVRIATPLVENMVEMHRNISSDILSKDRFNNFLSTLKKTDLDKYPEIDPLVAKIADHHQLKEDNIMVTSGIDGGLKSVFEMCTIAGDKIATYYPSYAMYDVYAKIFELTMFPIVIDTKTLTVTKEAIYRILEKDVAVLFLANPNMPIETSFSVADIEDIAERAQQYETLVVIDEAYALFGCDTSIPLISKYKNILVARTFSKAMGMPGIRMGYMLGNSKLISYLQTRRFAHESNALTVAAGIWALDHIEEALEIKDTVIRTREWFKSQLQDLGINCYGSLSNTVILQLESKEDVDSLSLALKQDGYLIKRNYPVDYENFSSITIGDKKIMGNVLSSIKNHLSKG